MKLLFDITYGLTLAMCAAQPFVIALVGWRYWITRPRTADKQTLAPEAEIDRRFMPVIHNGNFFDI